MITKLPFPVPNDPLHIARASVLEEKGQNAFKEYYIPLAITKFRQGIGRLIRGKKDKGAIFIPGGLIYQDVDENQIAYEPQGVLNEARFREKIRASMQYDNATLMFPDGLLNGVNLDSGFFARVSRRIYTFKKAAFKRKKRIGR